MVQGKLFSDDWIILLALVVDTVFLYGGFKLEDLGYGEHIWNVDPKNLTELMQWFYVEELLYILTNGLIKISMLIFYYRLFPSHRFRIWCKVMLAFCGATTITFAFATIFQCTPLSFSWDKNIQGGYCINFVAASWAHGGVNSLQDLAILIMPIPLIWKLQMTRTKKAGLSAIFGLGTL